MIGWADILERWTLLVADFRDVYGTSVSDESVGWVEFRSLVWGLLSSDTSRIARDLRPKD